MGCERHTTRQEWLRRAHSGYCSPALACLPRVLALPAYDRREALSSRGAGGSQKVPHCIHDTVPLQVI